MRLDIPMLVFFEIRMEETKFLLNKLSSQYGKLYYESVFPCLHDKITSDNVYTYKENFKTGTSGTEEIIIYV